MRRFIALGLFLIAAQVAAQGFDFIDTEGRPQRLADYRGKWVLVNFWATWCPACLEEIPELVDLHEAHRDKDLVVIGLALDSSEKSVHQVISKYAISYPIVIGNHALAQKVGEVKVLPTSYFYDPFGNLVSYQEGGLTRSSVESFLKMVR